jgi:2-aminoethylphosphonate-pyruvate transaminase
MKQQQRTILLNPGPVTLTERVRRALLHGDVCHREPEYSRLQTDVRERLARVYAEAAGDYVATLLTGSGTAAVEAMVGSLVPRDGRALVVANGIYGERIASILRTQGKEFDLVRSEWVEPIDVGAAERKLGGGRFTHVVTVHHETTTGRLNDLAALGELCRRSGVAMLVDAVSSFGGEAIDFAGWNVEGCAATANKCLHGVPGVSFVLARKSVFAERESGSPSVYLDLFRNYEEQAGGYPGFTPAVQVVAALGEALAELEEAGGWRRRHEHYAALSRKLRGELRAQGLGLLLGDARHYSAVLSSFFLPEGVAFDDLYRGLKEAGFVIYAGQKSLGRTIFRVAVMGDLTLEDIGDFTRELARVAGRAAQP